MTIEPSATDTGAKVDKSLSPPALSAKPARKLTFLWTMLNSSFALWLLSSVVLGGGVWLYQQIRDSYTYTMAQQERFERLNLEAAGRTVQYLSWMSKNIINERKEGVGLEQTISFEFKAGTTGDYILGTLQVFADLPRTRVEAQPYIQEMLPEFKDRNLFSIYGELSFINKKVMGVTANSSYECDARLLPPSRVSNNSVRALTPTERRAVYACAMVALLEPRWLLDNKDLDYDTFSTRFSDTFLNQDIQQIGFPYTDTFQG